MDIFGYKKNAQFQEDMATIMITNLMKDYETEDPGRQMVDYRYRCDRAKHDMSPKEYHAWLRGFQDGLGSGVIVAKGRVFYESVYGGKRGSDGLTPSQREILKMIDDLMEKL